jgi:hypothetical protein
MPCQRAVPGSFNCPHAQNLTPIPRRSTQAVAGARLRPRPLRDPVCALVPRAGGDARGCSAHMRGRSVTAAALPQSVPPALPTRAGGNRRRSPPRSDQRPRPSGVLCKPGRRRGPARHPSSRSRSGAYRGHVAVPSSTPLRPPRENRRSKERRTSFVLPLRGRGRALPARVLESSWNGPEVPNPNITVVDDTTSSWDGLEGPLRHEASVPLHLATSSVVRVPGHQGSPGRGGRAPSPPADAKRSPLWTRATRQRR